MTKTNQVCSVNTRMKRSLFAILILSVCMGLFSIVVLSSSQSDSKGINLAGSLRMQSYRIAFDVLRESPHYLSHLQAFEQTLSDSAKALNKNYVLPVSVKESYSNLVEAWHQLLPILESRSSEIYFHHLPWFVHQIDQYVKALEEHAEHKLKNLSILVTVGLGSIFCIVVFLIQYSKKKLFVH